MHKRSIFCEEQISPNILVPYNNGVVKNDTLSLVNGEANFEWQPTVKATTQLLTHVTSKNSNAAAKCVCVDISATKEPLFPRMRGRLSVIHDY